MRFRRISRRPTTEDLTDSAHDLLDDLTTSINRVSEAQAELRTRLSRLDDQLREIDGMAQRLALLGLTDEGVRVLDLQADLYEERLVLTYGLDDLTTLEARLQAARQHLDPDTVTIQQTTPVDTVERSRASPSPAARQQFQPSRSGRQQQQLKRYRWVGQFLNRL